MTAKSLVICSCILVNFTGVVAEDDRSLSTSSIIALSVLFGFILLVCLFCLFCFSLRKYRATKRRKKRRNSSRLGIANSSFVETQISTAEIESDKLQQNKNQIVNKQVDFQDSVDLVDENGKINTVLTSEEKETVPLESRINGGIVEGDKTSVQRVERIIESKEGRPDISVKSDLLEQNIQERNQNITSEIEFEIHTEEDILGSNLDSQEHFDQVNPMLNISSRYLENIERKRLASARSDSVDVHIDDNDYTDGLRKIIGDNSEVVNVQINADKDKLVENVTVQDIETQADSPKMVVQPNGVYTQASTEQVNTSYAPNGVVGPQLQRYTDWRNGNVTTQSMYLKNTSSTMNRSQIYDMRPRTRSISPNRYQQRTYERGRSVKRMVVPTQVVGQPYSSVRVQPINRAKIIRSRSAPPLRQMTYVTKVPESTGYTRSHYLAIKQPFSKKFLLPPVKVSEKFVPMGSQRVIVTKRPTVIPRPMPPPRQQEVIKGKVYHVQYNHQGSNTITRGVNALNLERTASASTNNSGQMYYSTGYNGQYVTRLSSNSSQGMTGRGVYTNQLSYNSDVFDSAVQGTSSRPTSQVIEPVATTSPRNGDPDYIYSTVIKTTEKVEQNGKADEYTIVDYVENSTSAGKTTSPLSTSTPRFPERDTSALEDLDNVLGKSGDTSSSSSSDEN